MSTPARVPATAPAIIPVFERPLADEVDWDGVGDSDEGSLTTTGVVCDVELAVLGGSTVSVVEGGTGGGGRGIRERQGCWRQLGDVRDEDEGTVLLDVVTVVGVGRPPSLGTMGETSVDMRGRRNHSLLTTASSATGDCIDDVISGIAFRGPTR